MQLLSIALIGRAVQKKRLRVDTVLALSAVAVWPTMTLSVRVGRPANPDPNPDPHPDPNPDPNPITNTNPKPQTQP